LELKSLVFLQFVRFLSLLAAFARHQSSRSHGLDRQATHPARSTALVRGQPGLGKNRWTLVKLRLSEIAAAVNSAKPGTYSMVEIPDR
jgi:hypothetical protein